MNGRDVAEARTVLSRHRLADVSQFPTPKRPCVPYPAGVVSDMRGRYVRDIIALNGRLSFRRLAEELRAGGACLYQADRGRGITVSAARSEDIPDRYLIGLAGFRLSQYLQAGYASADVVFDNSLFCEPVRGFGREDVHVIATDSGSGRILGYAALTHSEDPRPRPVNAADRVLFPCERAHGIRLLSLLPGIHRVDSHAVREVQRFVHDQSMTDRVQRLRVTLELLAGIVGTLSPPLSNTSVLVGDVEKHVALRHLVLLGLDVHVVEGTSPRLGVSDLMHPMYLTREKVHPFIAVLPTREEALRRRAMVEDAAASEMPFSAVRELLARLAGSIQSIEVAA